MAGKKHMSLFVIVFVRFCVLTVKNHSYQMSQKDLSSEVPSIPIPGLQAIEDTSNSISVAIDDSALPIDRTDISAEDPDKIKSSKKQYVYPSAECPICHKTLSNKYTLKSHLLRHENDGHPLKFRGRVPGSVDEDDIPRFTNPKECIEYIDKIKNELESMKLTLQNYCNENPL